MINRIITLSIHHVNFLIFCEFNLIVGPVKGFSQPRSDYMTEVKLTDIKNSSIAKNSSVELQRM